jgi:predicted GNAT superfamily acetyltransferase
MYGTTGSPLHGTVTDRLIVACPTITDPRQAPASAPAPAAARILTPDPQPGDALLSDSSGRPAAVWIEIPADIQQIVARSSAEADSWRFAVRDHFEWALGNGYDVTGLHRDPVTSRSFYTLELPPATTK